MQTFITNSPEFRFGVEYLDKKRLVKQLLECRQIMAALAGETKGWVNHPATKMWKGKEGLLWDYSRDVAQELMHRGYKWKNNFDKLTVSYLNILDYQPTDGDFSEEDFNKIVYTHRGRLFEKDPIHYAQWLPYADFKKNVCCDRCNYYWPTHLKE